MTDFEKICSKLTRARCQWLMLVILATQKVKIRRITVQKSAGQIVWETLS
jgi:hypothetical protein